MTDLIVRENTLPASLEDLSKFVLIGRDKLQAVRAEINAMKNLNLAKEVHEQKLREGQEIGKLVLLAEARLGELFKLMPKVGVGGNGSNQYKTAIIPDARNNSTDESDEEEPHPKPKLEVAAQMGFKKNQVAQFQKLADNPAAVQKAIATAQDNCEIVTRSTVLAEIKQAEKDAKQEERRERKSYTPPIELPANEFKLICADIRSGLLDIADNSVDFIITDPPYPKEYLPLLPLNRLSPVLLAALGTSSPFWWRGVNDLREVSRHKNFLLLNLNFIPARYNLIYDATIQAASKSSQKKDFALKS